MSSQTEQAAPAIEAGDLVMRIGQLTRMLRDSMRELGLDAEVEKAAQAIPDARDRLGYVATMTENAAERALNAIDRAQPLQDGLESQARHLDQRWAQWFDEPLEKDVARELVRETRAYLGTVPEVVQSTNKELLEIMMAQDFQDLTGQVIKKMMEVIQEVENQLLQVLLDNVPEPNREEMQRRMDQQKSGQLLNGPQVRDGEPDVLSDQDEVDDLLADLGF